MRCRKNDGAKKKHDSCFRCHDTMITANMITAIAENLNAQFNEIRFTYILNSTSIPIFRTRIATTIFQPPATAVLKFIYSSRTRAIKSSQIKMRAHTYSIQECPADIGN